MCLGFMLYYPRQKLADCRSLPGLQTVLSALGIKSLYGKSFEKLAAFLKDLGGTSNDGKYDGTPLLITLDFKFIIFTLSNHLFNRSHISLLEN